MRHHSLKRTATHDEQDQDDALPQAFLLAQRALLSAHLEQLARRAATAQRAVMEREHEIGDVVDGSMEEQEAMEAAQWGPREIALMHEVRASIDRIDSGVYNECDECGDTIGLKRLEVKPHATRCIACQEEREALERSKKVRAGLLDEYM